MVACILAWLVLVCCNGTPQNILSTRPLHRSTKSSETISRDGSSDRSVGCLELREEWKTHRVVLLSNAHSSQEVWETHTRPTTYLAPGPHNGPSGIGKSVGESLFRYWYCCCCRVATQPRWSHLQQVHFLVKHHCANRKDSLLSYATFLGVNVTHVQRQNCENFWAAGRLPSIRSTRDNTYDPTRFSFKHLVRKIVPDIVKVDGFDLDIREEGVHIEEHRASCVVSFVEPDR